MTVALWRNQHTGYFMNAGYERIRFGVKQMRLGS